MFIIIPIFCYIILRTLIHKNFRLITLHLSFDVIFIAIIFLTSMLYNWDWWDIFIASILFYYLIYPYIFTYYKKKIFLYYKIDDKYNNFILRDFLLFYFIMLVIEEITFYSMHFI